MGILVDCSCTIPTAFDTDFALLENVTANAAITKRDPRAVLDALFILAPPIGFPDSSGGGERCCQVSWVPVVGQSLPVAAMNRLPN